MHGMRMGAVLVVGALLGMATLDAAGQTVQKCRSSDGRTRYQSEPCLPGERVLEVWSAVPDPSPPATTMPRRAVPRRTRAPRAPKIRRYRAPAPTANACHAAKARRDAIERQVGLARTYELLSALSRDVHDACR